MSASTCLSVHENLSSCDCDRSRHNCLKASRSIGYTLKHQQVFTTAKPIPVKVVPFFTTCEKSNVLFESLQKVAETASDRIRNNRKTKARKKNLKKKQNFVKLRPKIHLPQENENPNEDLLICRVYKPIHKDSTKRQNWKPKNSNQRIAKVSNSRGNWLVPNTRNKLLPWNKCEKTDNCGTEKFCPNKQNFRSKLSTFLDVDSRRISQNANDTVLSGNDINFTVECNMKASAKPFTESPLVKSLSNASTIQTTEKNPEEKTSEPQHIANRKGFAGDIMQERQNRKKLFTSEETRKYSRPNKKHYTKRFFKIVEVEGVNYMVTMEPPGTSRMNCKTTSPQSAVTGSSNNASPPTSPFIRSSTVLVNGNQDPNHLRDARDSAGTLTPEQLNTWYQERREKCIKIDVADWEGIDAVDSAKSEALDHAALRLRNLLHCLDKGDNPPRSVLQKNLNYAISVMESSYLKHSGLIESREPPSDEEMLERLSSEHPVPREIKTWLMETFSKTKLVTEKKRTPERRSLRSVVHAVQAGMFVDRIYRKLPHEPPQRLPPQVEAHLKDLDKWTFNVFELERISGGNSLKYVLYKLLTKYNLIQKFKIPVQSLLVYCNKLQQGYRKHENQYHNPVHAADVAQTLNCFLVHSSFLEWMSDLEVFSMIMAAIVHDLEHTGTTNNFHINTRSSLAVLYNDKSVLENHHISAAFRMLQDENANMMCNFSKEDFQECRTLMIEMVLATDMVQHFSQVKRMNEMIKHPERLEKSTAMCLMIHAADINHPAKQWPLHYKWTERLLIEFFSQGDRERELGLPLSPLCDRHTTRVAQSQLGFIEYVITPMFSTMISMFKEVNGPVVRNAVLSQAGVKKSDSNTDGPSQSETNAILKYRFSDASSRDVTLKNISEVTQKLTEFQEMCFSCMTYNTRQWKKKDKVERESKLFGEQAFTDEGAIILDPPPPLLKQGVLASESDMRSNSIILTNPNSNQILNNGDDSRPP